MRLSYHGNGCMCGNGLCPLIGRQARKEKGCSQCHLATSFNKPVCISVLGICAGVSLLCVQTNVGHRPDQPSYRLRLYPALAWNVFKCRQSPSDIRLRTVAKDEDGYYEEVSTCNCHDEDDRPADEYDEPWEWTVGKRLASNLQVSPTPPLNPEESAEDREDEEDMATRQRHIYETAFDSRVKREVEDIDRLAQSPVLHSDYLRIRLGSGDGAGLRITSRPPSSTGSCSSSSTPTHQPRVLRESPRLAPRPFPAHLTPTEKRKVTLVRDPSSSPKSHQIRVTANVEPLPRTMLNNHNGSPFATKKPIHGHQGVKVLPSDSSKHKNTTDRVPNGTSLKTTKDMDQSSVSSDSPNNVPRKVAALETTQFPCHTTSSGDLQSPHNDNRPSGDYDPPWQYPKLSNRPVANNATTTAVETPPLSDVKTEPSENSQSASDSSPPLSHSKPDIVPPLTKPSGPPARPNLNLNLNLNATNSPKRARQNLTLNFGCFALNAVGETVDPSIPLEKQGWYHGSISRLDAENLLRVLKEGSYLVRNSESSKQDYSLSLKSARGFMHMKIVHSSGQFILGQFSKPFPSIPDMIYHYSINKLPIKGAEHMSLLYPVIDQLL